MSKIADVLRFPRLREGWWITLLFGISVMLLVYWLDLPLASNVVIMMGIAVINCLFEEEKVSSGEEASQQVEDRLLTVDA